MSTSRKGTRCRHRTAWRDLSVTDLVLEAQAGNEEAWRELVRRFTPVVEHRVRSSGLSSGSADDAVQLTWVKLASSLGKLRDPERLPGWLAVTARNEAINVIRQSARAVCSDDFEDRPEPGPAIDRGLINGDEARTVNSALDELTDRQRAVVELRYLDDEPGSYTDIARDLGMPIGAIGPTLGRALDALRSDPAIAALH